MDAHTLESITIVNVTDMYSTFLSFLGSCCGVVWFWVWGLGFIYFFFFTLFFCLNFGEPVKSLEPLPRKYILHIILVFHEFPETHSAVEPLTPL